MIRPATHADVPAIARLLARRPAQTMFMAEALTRGTEGFWLMGDTLAGVVFLTSSDILLPDAPRAAPADWAALGKRLAGRAVRIVNGAPDSVGQALGGLGLAAEPPETDDTQPLFTLDLAALRIPEGPTRLRAMTEADLPALAPWRMAHNSETHGRATDAEALRAAEAELRRMIDADRGRVLEQDGTPRAICGFNAALPDRVQVGAVYTPPEHRNRGHARRAVALHLAEAREAGIREACLFAASPAAVRAYLPLGFQRAGEYRIAFLAPGGRIGA